MKPGTKPRAPELKILAGEEKSRINAAAPKAIPGHPQAPDNFDAYALEEWHSVCADLADLGVLSRTDRGALILYCEAWSKCRKADDEWRKKPDFLIPNGQGTPKANPLLAEINHLQLYLLRCLVEFGLTPSARNRVSARPAGDENTLRGFLKKKAKAEA